MRKLLFLLRHSLRNVLTDVRYFFVVDLPRQLRFTFRFIRHVVKDRVSLIITWPVRRWKRHKYRQRYGA